MFSFHLCLGDISCPSGRWKAGGEQWNALSCLPLTQPPAEFTQRVILEACGACGRPPVGGVAPSVRELETDCWMGRLVPGGLSRVLPGHPWGVSENTRPAEPVVAR